MLSTISRYPVGDLDEDDADILGHGEQHLAHVFHLLVFLARILHTRQFGDTFHKIGDGAAEFAGDILVRERGVLNDVVQQGGHDGILVKPHIQSDLRSIYAVGHIRGTVLALLPLMGTFGHLVGGTDAPDVKGSAGSFDTGFKLTVKSIGIKAAVQFQRGSIHIITFPIRRYRKQFSVSG